MIKCIVSDLDGTLIKVDDTIESATYEALQDYKKQGIEFMIATGRDYNMVIDFLNAYNLDCDLILNNGTQYCNYNQTVNDIYPMDTAAFEHIATILQKSGYLLAIHTNKGKYSFHDKEAFWKYHMELLIQGQYGKEPLPKKTYTTREGYLRDFHYAKDAKEIIQQGIKVLKIDARHIKSELVKGIKEQLHIDHLDISSSYEENMEITSNTTNKGKLLTKIIQDKGYQVDEVAVFGDGENDCSMLEYFPYSFAPSNACDKAKQAATYVLQKTNIDGAVLEGMKVLKNKQIL